MNKFISCQLAKHMALGACLTRIIDHLYRGHVYYGLYAFHRLPEMSVCHSQKSTPFEFVILVHIQTRVL